MKTSVAMPTLAFVVLGLYTSAYAKNVEHVRRELKLQGYDQIEFTQTRLPFWVNVCRGGKRLRLHVDNYGKITKKILTGFCHEDGSRSPAAASPEVVAAERAAEKENSTISAAPLETDKTVEQNTVETVVEPKDEPKTTKNLDCKKFFPAVSMTLTVPCE